MLARLWWKEARRLWPIWVSLAAVAGAVQGLALWYVGPGPWSGQLAFLAVAWAALYGFLVTAAAFAGEREDRTLTFLDTLPVGRGMLWSGKASFAVVSTFALALVMLGLPATLTRDLHNTGPAAFAFAAVAVLLEVIGWGLFWSSVSGSAVTAAVLAICSVGLVVALLLGQADFASFAHAAPFRLLIALATTAASALVVTGRRPWPKASAGYRPTRRPESARRWGRRRGSRHDREPEPARLWPTAARSLAWASARQIGAVGWWAVVVALVVAFSAIVLPGDGFIPLGVVLAMLTAVTAGVTIFGSENQGRTHRFLAHHGARPALVWAVKNAVWAAGLALLWTPLAVAGAPGLSPANRDKFLLFTAAAFTCVAVGQLCGMTFRRGITAMVIAVVASAALILPQLGLHAAGMETLWGMSAAPLALLAVSWAWSGDWMLDRPGLARWGRLALLLTAASGVVFASYIASRAWGIPETRPDLAASTLPLGSDPATTPGAENAAGLYLEASSKLPNGEIDAKTFLQDKGHGEALTLIRRASAMPVCRFAGLDRIDRMTLFTWPDLPNFHRLGQLMELSVRDRQSRGDLAGAWADLLVMFRMARHLTGNVPLSLGLHGLGTERKALSLALTWAADPGQTPALLRAALDQYRGLPPMPPLVGVVRAEAGIADRTLRLPVDELRAGLLETMGPGRRQPVTSFQSLRVTAITTPWELARARRAFGFLFLSEAAAVSLEPYERGGRVPGPSGGRSDFLASSGRTRWTVPGVDPSSVLKSTPLASYLMPHLGMYLQYADRNEVGRRALLQVLALRNWQVRHGGRLPDRLDETLYAEEMFNVRDPYSYSGFGYVPSSGQPLLPLGRLDPISSTELELLRRPTAGYRLLYSIGADLHDDHAFRNETIEEREPGDIIFPLAETAAKADPK